MTSIPENTNTGTGQPDNSSNGGFPEAIQLIFLACLAAIIAQNLFFWSEQGAMGKGLAVAGILVVVGLFVFLFGKSMYRIVDTPYFAVTATLFIALGTALGTFVTQNSSAAVFTERYGESGSRILRIFQMNDIFHSWWYVTLFLLLIVSLVKLSLKRSFSLPNLGFHLAHLGPIIVLFGFWWDYYAGFRGLIQLTTGKETNLVNVYHRNTNRVKDSLYLDFQIRLDTFESERYAPDHRIQLWKKAGPTSSEIITSLPPDTNKTWKIFDTDITFQLVEFYPNFYLEYSYPEGADTIEAKAPGMMLELKTPHGKDMFQLRSDVPGRNIFDLPGVGAALEFYWELPEEINKAISNYSPGSAWAEKPRIVFAGKQGMMYESINGELSSQPVELERYYPIGGKDNVGFTIFTIFPDIAYLSSKPKTLDDKQDNPIARLVVNSKSWPKSESAFLFPNQSGPGGQYFVPGTNYFLALESIKDKETKYWKSDLSIIGENDVVEKQRSIKVNEPFIYSGYRFYQTDYDPNNPRYSGIGVSYAPGLYLIYFGFFVLVAGVFQLFYLRFRNQQLS